MKKQLLLILLSTSLVNGFAQLNKGNFLIGGNASFQSEKNTNISGTSKGIDVQMAPNVGYFAFDKLGAGVRTLITTSRHQQPNREIYKYHSFSVAPFLRYYFLARQEKVNLFADASYEFSKLVYDVDSRISQKYRGYSIAAGPAFFLNPHVALELSVGYNHMSTTRPAEKRQAIVTALGLQVHLDNK